MVLTEKQSLEELYSKRGRNISPPRVGDPSKSAEIISFIYGFPDPESLPAKTVADAAVHTSAASSIDSATQASARVSRRRGVRSLRMPEL